MEKFRTVTYEVHNPKIKKSVRFAVLADLHGSIFGEENSALLKKIQENVPDAILLAGDMVVRMDPSTLETARKLLCTLAKNFPIFYAMGNHETKMKAKGHLYRNEYLKYQAELKQKGICFLANEKNKVVLAGNSFVVNGLELPLEYYHKPFSPKLTSEKMEELMGKPDPEAINILLAHNPKYGRTYFHWGADLDSVWTLPWRCAPFFQTCGSHQFPVYTFSKILLRRFLQKWQMYDRKCRPWGTHSASSDP